MKTKSNYEFVITPEHGHPKPFILIRDLDKGGMSVTNDAENVLRRIRRGLARPLHGYLILYRDSLGNWDQMLVNNQDEFTGFEMGPEGEWDKLFELRTK